MNPFTEKAFTENVRTGCQISHNQQKWVPLVFHEQEIQKFEAENQKLREECGVWKLGAQTGARLSKQVDELEGRVEAANKILNTLVAYVERLHKILSAMKEGKLADGLLVDLQLGGIDEIHKELEKELEQLRVALQPQTQNRSKKTI